MKAKLWLPGLAVLVLGLFSVTRAADWPQWMGPNRDGVWSETGILEKFPPGGPTIPWRVKIGGGYAGPAVAGGKVYVTDFLTDADTYKLSNPNKRAKIEGKERVLCLDAKTGAEEWKHVYDCTYEISYPAGPRCTPTIAGGKVYTLGAEGNLFCLDAAKGTVVWSKDFKKDYKAATPFWGYTGHPLVDGDRLICLVGGKGSTLVAFDKDTGKELWKALSAKDPGYCAPSIIEAGGKRQLLIWTPEEIHGLDPATGKVYWSNPLVPAYGMSIVAPRKYENYLFTGGIGEKAVLLELDQEKPGVKEVWTGKRDTALYPVNSTPVIVEGTMYGVDQPGQLRAVDVKTGKRLWETFKPTTGKGQANSGTGFLVKNGGRFFIFSETGDLIIAKLTPKGYEEIDRAHLLEPTQSAFGRNVIWSHPAFAEKCCFARNDKEIICAALAK